VPARVSQSHAARYGAIEGALRERHKTKNLHDHLGHDQRRADRVVEVVEDRLHKNGL
jgi:hypothetical protein